MIIDAHHHIWRYRRGAEPWIDERDELAILRRDYTATELRALLRANGIDRSVIIQASDSVEETLFMAEQAAAFPFVGGIVGWLPLDSPRATEQTLEAYTPLASLKGFRHMIIWEKDPEWLLRPTVLESLALVAERGYSWDSTATSTRHLEQVSVVSERYPNLRHVIDHLGKPAATERAWEPWASLMARAAAHPNVHVKLSGLTNVATLKSATVEQFRPYVDWVLEHFGAGRVMLGSNWPVSLLGADYATTWRDLVSLISNRSEQERAALMGATAARFYRLE